MAMLEIKVEVDAFLDETGVGLTLYIGDDDEGQTVNIAYDDMFDDLMESVCVDNEIKHPDDRKHIEALAKAFAELSKDLYCVLKQWTHTLLQREDEYETDI